MARVLIAILLTCISAANQAQDAKIGSGLEIEKGKVIPLRISISGEGLTKLRTRLTEERVRGKVELRLRQAGITPEADTEFEPTIVASVFVVGKGYTTRIEMNRLVAFYVNGQQYITEATTYNIAQTGTHGGDGEYIVGGMDALLDAFLNELLKSNP